MREKFGQGSGSILMPGMGPAMAAQAPQAQPMVLSTPLNDTQLLALMASYQPVSLTPAEALERSLAILAGAVLMAARGDLQNAVQQGRREAQSGA